MISLRLIRFSPFAIGGSSNRCVGNLPPMPGVFPDYPAPVVRNAGAERECGGHAATAADRSPPVTNICNTSSPHWRGGLKPENRCLVMFNSFAEYAPEPNPETKKKDVVWFALNDDSPMAWSTPILFISLARCDLRLPVRRNERVTLNSSAAILLETCFQASKGGRASV